MKKIILLTTFILCFLQGRSQLFHEDFEVADSVISFGTQGWFPNNRLSVGGSFCDSSSLQIIGDTTILSTLFFDCTSATKVFLSFDHICKTELSDKAFIEVSNDSGNTFTTLNNTNCIYSGTAPTWNLQNNFSCNYPEWLPSLPNAQPENTWWKHEVFNLGALLSNHANVLIHFSLSDANNNGGGNTAGWFIDNLRVDTVAPPDAGVTAILNFGTTTEASSQKPVNLVIKNYSADTTFSFNAGYSINGGTSIVQPWTGILKPGDTVSITLPSYTVPLGSYNLCAFTDLNGDINNGNDTLCLQSFGLPLVGIPYADDFEGVNTGWYEPNTAPYPTLWELGTPNYGNTNSAHSGIRAWDTNLDTSYIGPCNSILYSPFFNFSGVGNAAISFWLNYKTEPLSDGLRLEYNANNSGWYSLGTANNPLTNNWYTDSLLNSSQQPAWEGNSGGWIQTSYPLPSLLANQASVQFRFIFTSDNSVNNDGVSIDDFAISYSTCGNSINYSTTSFSCGDSILFNLNSTAPVANVFWDMGNGTSFTQPTVSSFYTFGNYLITLYTVDSNGCEASSVININSTNGFSVNAGPDVFSCGAASQLAIIPSQPGAYNFSWAPIAGLNNPFIADPTAGHVDSLTYTITVTDTITGCVASDQVMVAAYSAYNDSIIICKGGVTILDLGPGATSYQWQNFTDTTGNIIALTDQTRQLLISEPGLYTASALFPTCGQLNSSFLISIDSNCITDVWPGDCNYDLTANNFDLLNIGISYGKVSTLRPGASNTWIAQPSPDWPYYFSAGINYKHSDCNGDGTIDTLDVPVILQNYGLVHPPKPFEQSLLQHTVPPLYLTANVDTAGISDQILVAINLGTSTIPVDSIYGIAFTVNYDQSLIDTTSASWDYSNSWLGIPGTEIIGLEKHFSAQGYSAFALTRKNQVNVFNGSGTLGVMTIVTTDNLSGKALLRFSLSDVKAITYDEQVIQLGTIGDTVVLDPNFTGMPNEYDVNNIQFFPNPVKSELIIKAKNCRVLSIEIKNVLGQLIRKTEGSGFISRINLADQPQGILFLSVLTDKGVISKMVQVIK